MVQRDALSKERQSEPICKIFYVLEMNFITAETGTNRQDRKGLTTGGGSGLKAINRAMRS